MGENRKRLTEVEKAVYAIPYLSREISAIAEDCRKNREWVESQIERAEEEEEEKERISTARAAPWIAGAFVVIVALVQLVATLIQAGHP